MIHILKRRQPNISNYQPSCTTTIMPLINDCKILMQHCHPQPWCFKPAIISIQHKDLAQKNTNYTYLPSYLSINLMDTYPSKSLIRLEMIATKDRTSRITKCHSSPGSEGIVHAQMPFLVLVFAQQYPSISFLSCYYLTTTTVSPTTS